MRLLHPLPGARVTQRFGAQLSADPGYYLWLGYAGHKGPQLTPSDQVQPYGMRPVAGGYEVQPYVDLLAWREGDDWHIKRLMQG